MKKLFSVLALACSTIFFVGCFDITEEITVSKDGSGKYQQTTDASKMEESLAMFAASDSTGQMMKGLKHSLDSLYNGTFEAYKKVKGISNIKIDTSIAFVYKIEVDFDNIQSLNKMLQAAAAGANKGSVYALEKGIFTRNDEALNLDNELLHGEGAESMKTMMAEMKYTTIVHLPSKVTNMTNKTAVLSDDKKTVTVSGSFADLLDEKLKLGNVMKF